MSKHKPVILLTPRIRALIHQCLKRDTEVSFFGVFEPNTNVVVGAYIPKQECTASSVEIDDDDLQNIIIQACQDGYSPADIRFWAHTHPEMSATPSSQDWKTFDKCFEGQAYSLMYIASKTGDESLRLRSEMRMPGGATPEVVELGIGTKWDVFDGVTHDDIDAWNQLLDEKVSKPKRQQGHWMQDSWRPQTGGRGGGYKSAYTMGKCEVIVGTGKPLPDKMTHAVEVYGNGDLVIDDKEGYVLKDGITFDIQSTDALYTVIKRGKQVHVTKDTTKALDLIDDSRDGGVMSSLWEDEALIGF